MTDDPCQGKYAGITSTPQARRYRALRRPDPDSFFLPPRPKDFRLSDNRPEERSSAKGFRAEYHPDQTPTSEQFVTFLLLGGEIWTAMDLHSRMSTFTP
ncbi:MAG: hypothetical protein B7Y54_00110 [Polaromonas sp. 35-63-240]|nr:MAG: hypothetical protein B7Y54_00110 [Polaromonas sp. 35-63-240]OYZ03548.1 MAG: hypothetical protein B7Y42_00110 [Polaromonas sp. 28-63-22]